MRELNKFFRTYKQIIISVFMIALSACGVIFGSVPLVKKIIEVRNQSIELSKSIQMLRTKISILSVKDEMTYKAQLTELLQAVPSDKSITSLFTTIDGLGAQSGVTLSELTLARPGVIATESAVRQTNEEKLIGSSLLPYAVTVTGSYQQIYQFLAQVNNVRRLFRVKNFQISFENPGNISVHMGMDAFFAPLAQIAGSADSPLDPITEKEEELIFRVSQMAFLGAETGINVFTPQMQSVPRPDPFSL
jgi:Tfp pilus assembly protein PilO